MRSTKKLFINKSRGGSSQSSFPRHRQTPSAQLDKEQHSGILSTSAQLLPNTKPPGQNSGSESPLEERNTQAEPQSATDCSQAAAPAWGQRSVMGAADTARDGGESRSQGGTGLALPEARSTSASSLPGSVSLLQPRQGEAAMVCSYPKLLSGSHETVWSNAKGREVL